MANEYDKLIEKQNEALDKAIESVTTPAVTPEPATSVHLDVAVFVACAIIVVTLVWVTYKKRWLAWNSFSHQTKKVISAWGVWVLFVSTYVILLKPYGGDLSDEEITNLILWLVLPPIATLALYQWLRRYYSSAKKHEKDL